MVAVEVPVLLAVKKVFHQFYTSFPHASRWVLCLFPTLLYIGCLNRSEAVRLLLHLLPGGVGVEQRGVDIGVARLVCQIGNGVSILQGLEQKKWRRVCGVMDSEYSLKIRLTWLRVRWLSPRPGNR